MRRFVPALACLAWLGLPALAGADGLMLIRAGAFWMGRDGGPPEEAPLHRVFVTDFWIDRHKVTNAEFAEFLDAEGVRSRDGERRFDDDDADARIHRVAVEPTSRAERRRAVRWRPDAGFERHPVVEVSWFGARDYCRWKGRRLPTEAEWEKAARGDDRRPYPWGAAPPSPELAVYGRRYNDTAPADRGPRGASPYGVEDMVGNLREWTATALRPYPYKEADERGQWSGEGRVVVRGASHDDPVEELSLTRRRSYDRRGAAAGHHYVGFRCATSEDLGGY
jgi:formylglycine-generating enzyme required for sulfatase activity